MNTADQQARNAIKKAFIALKRGQRLEARRCAEQAARLDPDNEQAWLILGVLASPRASVHYIIHALEINPNNIQARKGIHWAVSRLRNEPQNLSHSSSTLKLPQAQKSKSKHIACLTSGVFLLTAVFCFSLMWFAFPRISKALNKSAPLAISGANLHKATNTHTITMTHTHTASSTPTTIPTFTSTPIFTPTSTPSPTYTSIPTSSPTFTPVSTNTPVQLQIEQTTLSKLPADVNRPEGVKKHEPWIDVVLSRQRMYVYQGNELVDKFKVSTGISKFPTIKGIFKIYVKYEYADMKGPGYHLRDVPYVMYFSGDYGIHGTYWHNNFGMPMSHGCVNMNTEDAEWLFKWAKVGTVVRVRK